ncbi:MAG: hypothetical protein OXC94_04570 [Chloroflexi bacterium]|nr:hypothetical protein [Chloroflexota bacterium]
MHQNRILRLASIAVGVAIAVTVGFIVLNSGSSESPPAAVVPDTPAPAPVVATVTTQVANTPTPVPTPRPPAPLVVTPVPTPAVEEAEAEPRPGKAPWVYYFPSQWVPDVNEWPESLRWQEPLPTIETPPEWGENTWRTPYPTFEGYRDRPFIRAYDRPYETLTRQVEADMYEIFGKHQQLQAEWAVMLATADTSGLEPYITGNLEAYVRDIVNLDLHGQNVRAQIGPYVHEIIAMTIFGDRAEVLQVYREWSGNYYDAETGELKYGAPPWDTFPEGNVSYTYAQWQRIDGRWTETSATFSSDSDLSPVEWIAAASPPLVPYLAIWENALAQQAAARGGG